MCLGIPKKVISIRNNLAIIKSAKRQQVVGTLIKVKKGDWVLTQQGVIVRKIGKKEAKEIDNLLVKK